MKIISLVTTAVAITPALAGAQQPLPLRSRVVATFPPANYLPMPPVRSGDGEHVLRFARRNATIVPLVNGRAGTPRDSVVRYGEFSPDGRSHAFITVSGGAARLVQNDSAGAVFDRILRPPEVLGISPWYGGAGQLAYVGVRGGRSIVVAGGMESPPCDAVRFAGFTPDGGHFLYAARTGGSWRMMRDGKADGEYEGISGTPAVSPDGHLAYTARRAGATWLVVDGEERLSRPRIDEVALSRGARRAAFATSDASGAWVEVDGQRSPTHAGVALLTFSDDGEHFGYVTVDGDSAALVLDGVVRETFPQQVRGFSLSATGGRVAVTGVRNGQVVTVIDGRGVPLVAHDWVRFGPDGKRVAYVAARDAQQTRQRVVVDGVAHRFHRSVSTPVFSPDGRHVAYVASDADGNRLVLDGRASKPVTASLDGTRIRFEAGLVRVPALRDRTVLLYEAAAP